MNDDQLGRATGAWLRDLDRPANDPEGTVRTVMAAVPSHPQRRPRRRWPWGRGPAVSSDTAELTAVQLWTHPGNGRTPAPAPRPIEGGRTLLTLGSLTIAAIGVIAAGAFLVSGGLPSDDGSTPGAGTVAPAVAWKTDRVSLTADAITLEVNGLVFGQDVRLIRVMSDLGWDTYWTLEVDWGEHGVAQRLNLYFAADDSDWWVDEIRTYDGYEKGEWITAYGPFMRTPLGEAYDGDFSVELVGTSRPHAPHEIVTGRLSFEDLRLAVSPSDQTEAEALRASLAAQHETRTYVTEEFPSVIYEP